MTVDFASIGRRAKGAYGESLLCGPCTALDESLAPGDLVLASEVRTQGRTIPLPSSGILAGMMSRRGVHAHVGPIVSQARSGEPALAAESEPRWLADPGAMEGPLAVLGGVVDAPAETREARGPLDELGRAFDRAAGVLAEWAAAVQPRRVLLAAPRASCAGVERAIETVELALERFGPPLYVRRQIVHNAHVVAELEERGVVFVEEVDEVPEHATVVFSAHGVSPAVRLQAARRSLHVVDATCPLVAKVHAEARRFARAGHTVLLIGHEGHDEVEGTLGEAPARTVLVESREQAAVVEVDDPERVAYLTQTTLATDDTADIVQTLRRRFPRLAGPPTDDICYATQNRQDAVRKLAAECGVMLVIGSRNSSNSKRLVEVAERAGCRAHLIDDERELEPTWLRGVDTVGLSAGASAPEAIVQRVLGALEQLGPLTVEQRQITTETVQFRPPAGLRG